MTKQNQQVAFKPNNSLEKGAPLFFVEQNKNYFFGLHIEIKNGQSRCVQIDQ